MKTITLIGKRMLATALLACCMATGFAQKWNFDPAETKAFANWFKQPSTEQGKINAEVLGIDIKRAGFSWDDMNTWADASGTVFLEGYNTAYVHTIWGGGFSGNATFKGRLHYLWMSLHKGADGKYDEVGGWQAIPAAMVAGLPKVAGKINFGSLVAGVVNISGTNIETVKLAMDSPNDCYCNIKRNPKLTQVDFSGSKGKLRQADLYKNAFSDANSFLCNDCRQTEFLDWLLNLSDNLYTLSTIPLHPITDKVLANTDSQWKTAGGYPIGIKNADGVYEIAVDEDIDLSSELDVKGKITNYTWKNEDGEVVIPSSASNGYFTFDKTCVGKVVLCEMKNETYPKIIFKTVFVKVVDAYSTGIETSATEEFTVNPNPADDVLFISGNDIQNVKIYSLAGLCVKNINSVMNSIDVSDLAKGLYTIQVITAEGEKVTKFIKK